MVILVSGKWLHKHELKKDSTDRHVNVDGERRGTPKFLISIQRTTGTQGIGRVGEAAQPHTAKPSVASRGP